MGCSSSDDFLDYVGMMCSPYGNIEAYRAGKFRDELKKLVKLETRSMSNSFAFAKDPTIRNCSELLNNLQNTKNKDLYIKILQENDRLAPLLKAKLDR